MSADSENARATLQSNARLRLEMLAAISRVFRENGAKISDGFLSRLVLAEPKEISVEGAGPSIDPPTPTNP